MNKTRELNKENVNNLLEAAKRMDKDLKVFGASSHKYELNPVISLEKVQDFEKKYGLKLPPAYVKFLTEIGNGGAGPDYGLYSLEIVEANNSGWLNQDASREAFIDEKMTDEMWKKAMGDEDDEYDEDEYDEDEYDEGEYDDIMSRVYTGMLIIGTQGCTYDTLLMCKGSEYGKIVYIDWNLEGDCPPYLTDMTFEEWYIRFFEEIANGRDVGNYGCYYFGNEEDLIRGYNEEKSVRKKKKFITSLSGFDEFSQSTIEFLMNINDKDVDSERLYTLLRVSNTNGMLLLDKFLADENKAAASEHLRWIPDDKKDKYYQQILTMLYEENEADKKEILFFLRDCNCRRAADLVRYVMDATNPEDTRETAIYVMGKCKDAKDYIDEFIELMKKESDFMVDEILTTLYNAGLKSPKLTQCYEWLAQKHKDGGILISNLERVLGRKLFERNFK